jgi:DNA-binding transcriptional MerR regulator
MGQFQLERERPIVSHKTLRRWDREGRLKPERTSTGRRSYAKALLDAVMRRSPSAAGDAVAIAECRAPLKNRTENLSDAFWKISARRDMAPLPAGAGARQMPWSNREPKPSAHVRTFWKADNHNRHIKRLLLQLIDNMTSAGDRKMQSLFPGVHTRLESRHDYFWLAFVRFADRRRSSRETWER